MPVSVLERDEASAADACDRLGTGSAALGKQLAEAVGTIRLVIPGGEALAGQGSVAVGAREALSVPGFVLVCHAPGSDDLATLDTTCSKLLLIASSAVYLQVPGDEALGTNGSLAHTTAETLLVPLSSLVLHLLVTCPEDLSTTVASRSKLGVVARTTEDLVHFGAELLVYEGHLALVAQEAFLVPVLVLVR